MRILLVILSLTALCLSTWSSSSRAELVGYWPLDGNTQDRTSNGLNGELLGDAEFVSDVPSALGGGMSLLLNTQFVAEGGVSQDEILTEDNPGYVDLGNPEILNFSDNDFTIAAWMKVPEALFQRGNIFSNGGDNSGGVRYVLAYLENGGQSIVLTTDDNVNKRQAQADAFDFPVDDEQWHHVVGLREGTELRVYVDGELGGENLDVPPDYDLSGTEQRPVYIGLGADSATGNFEKFFQGWVDDVAIWNEALTDDQIGTVMSGDFSQWGITGADGMPALQAGDADQDLDFDQIDLVQVQVAARYLTGQAATWGEGDWNGAPGGQQGSPPAGDGQFNQLDIIAALNSGTYLMGPYAAIASGGTAGDGQTSIIYDPSSGEVMVDAPAGAELTSINMDSAAGIFTGGAAENLGGSFDNDADNNIFKATFGGSFGSLSFGNVAQPGLSEDFVANDLSVVGSLAGGGDLGAVDLIYVPEPASSVLLAIGLVIGVIGRRSRRVG